MIIKNYRKTISIIAALLSTLSFGLNYNWEGDFFSHFDGNNVFLVFLFVGLSVFYNFMLKQNLEKRMIICTAILSFLLANFYIVGHTFQFCHYLEILGSKAAIIKSFIRILGYGSVIFSSLIYFYQYFVPWLKELSLKQNTFPTNKKSHFFITFGIIFFCYFLYLLKFFPGSLSYDSINQLSQAIGLKECNNHHPLLQTFCIALTIKIAGIFSDNIHYGILLYSVFQMITISAVFAYTLYFLAEQNIPHLLRLLTFFYFALFPIFGLFSITMWKDIPFGMVMTLYLIIIFCIIKNPQTFWKNNKNLYFFIIISILVCLFRNNGFYVVLLTIPFVIFFNKKFIKKVSLVCAMVLSGYFVWQILIFGILDFKQGEKSEMFSVPLQFFARLTSEKSDRLSQEEKEKIHNFLPVDANTLAAIYSPILSDNVKDIFDENYYNNHKFEFFAFWAKETIKNPFVAACSFINNNYGYWYPDSDWLYGFAAGIDSRFTKISDEITLENKTIFDFPIINFFVDMSSNHKKIPIINTIYSVGFMFWIVLVILYYHIIQKKYNKILIIIPILILWFTCLASPVFCEYRYMFALVCSLPIIFASMLNKS